MMGSRTDAQGFTQATPFLTGLLSLLVATGGVLIPLVIPTVSPAQITVAQQKSETGDARLTEAERLVNQGIAQFNTSQFEAAMRSWEQSLSLYRELRNRYGEAASLGNLGLTYHALGNYLKAIEFQEQRLTIVREIKDRRGEGGSLGALGDAYQALGNYLKAVEFQEQRLVITREIQDRQGEGGALGGLGNAYYRLGDYSKAITYYDQWLAISQEIKDRFREGSSLGALGNTYYALGNYAKAIEYHEQALAIAREIKNRQGEGSALGGLGDAYQALGNYLKAATFQEQWLVIAQEIKDRQGEGGALGGLGNAYYRLGDYSKAIAYYDQWLAIARESQNRLAEGSALGALGISYYALGNYAKAVEYHEQALTIAREIKNRFGERLALGGLGNAYQALGNYPKAIEYRERQLKISQETKDRQGEGNALGGLGDIYQSLRNYQKAIEYQGQGLAIAREIKDRLGESGALGGLGNAYYRQGDYPKAIAYYEQWLAITQEIKDLRGQSGALGGLGIAYYSSGDYSKAIKYQEQAVAIARELKDRSGEGRSLGNLGLARFKAGQLSQAEQDLFAAIAVQESLRLGLQDTDKVSIADTQRNDYNNLQRVLIAQNKVELALEVAERGRSRAFVELLSKRVQAIAAPPAISISEIQKVARTKQSALVQYSIISTETGEALFIWVVQPSGSVNFRQVDLESLRQTKNTTLENLIHTARCLGFRACEQSIAQQGTRQIIFNLARVEELRVPSGSNALSPNSSLQQLHQLLISPIADLLPKDQNVPVIFIPHYSLFLVPFAALQDSAGNYLIDKHTILSAPSIQVLQLTQEQRQKLRQSGVQDNLVVGNPLMPKLFSVDGKTSFSPPPLPGAELEAKMIAPLLNTKPLLGAQATEAEILKRMPQSRIIHLATHGIFDDQQGLQTAIALAPSEAELKGPNANDRFANGWLTANKILDLDLKAELVVLSACDTGRGRITGDGVIGLSRSLISAGVPSVLVSLWAVPDAPTAFLMMQFYQNLQQSPNKARALRQAMLDTKKGHPHPKDWAAFVLIGEIE